MAEVVLHEGGGLARFPTLEHLARDAFEQLLPTVGHLLGKHPTIDQQHEFFVGYHHQRGALWDVAGFDPERPSPTA